MGVYYGMNGLWVPVGGQGGAAPIDPNLLAENIKSGVTISGVTGTFTNDGTATASDIASGATAYVNGEKVTGNVRTFTSKGSTFSDTIPMLDSDNGKLELFYTMPVDTLFRAESGGFARCDLSSLGDATAADVASGKTFTSSAGLKVTGTGSMSYSFNVHVADIDLSSASTSITFTIDNVIIKDDIANSYACHGMAFLVYGELLNGNYDITSAEFSYDGSGTWEAYTMNAAKLLANSSKVAMCSYNNSTGELTITSYSSSYKFVAGTWCLAMSYR